MKQLTDTELLDWLQKQSEGFPWIARRSTTGRGYRLHTDPRIGVHEDVREAIRAAIVEERELFGKDEAGLLEKLEC